ncbi:MAG: membrane protein [Sediminibacterium sp.]
MGGLSAAYSDGLNSNVGQSVNFNNPATYSNFFMVSYDIGVTIDSRTLTSNNPTGKFNSNYFVPSYMALGVPLKRSKGWGLAFGLRPVSRINYSVHDFSRTAGDSLATTYQGSGGLNQLFVGVGKKWKGLSIGVNTGYNFGRKEINTKKTFINDTVFYYQSNSSSITHFNGVFLNAGIQYEVSLHSRQMTDTKTTENYLLRFGATASLNEKLSASQDISRHTYTQSTSGDIKIDSIFDQNDVKGKIELPATYAGGITYHKTASNARGIFELWSIGAEYTTTQWTKYRFYGQPDQLSNSWKFKVGAQFSPDPISGRSYWSNVNYRAGFYIGKDYVNADGNGLKEYGVSFGAGLPIKKWNTYNNQFTVMNTAFQFGKRGSGVNNITESYFQVSLGVSLSDIWFIKRKYD